MLFPKGQRAVASESDAAICRYESLWFFSVQHFRALAMSAKTGEMDL